MFINIIPILLRNFISLSWGHVSEVVKSQIEMYDSVKDTAKPAFYAASAYASWIIIFTHIYHLHSDNSSVESRAPYTDRVGYSILLIYYMFLIHFALLACPSRAFLFFLSPGLVWSENALSFHW